MKDKRVSFPDSIYYFSTGITVLCLSIGFYYTAIQMNKSIDTILYGFLLEMFGAVLLQYLIIYTTQMNDEEKMYKVLSKFGDDRLDYICDSYIDYFDVLGAFLMEEKYEQDKINNTLKFIDNTFNDLMDKCEDRMLEIKDRIKSAPLISRRNSF
jgi:hypothetical protein